MPQRGRGHTATKRGGHTATKRGGRTATKGSYHHSPLPLCRVLLQCAQVPQPVRDALYDVVAARRYSWFGKTPKCQVGPMAMCSCIQQRGITQVDMCGVVGIMCVLYAPLCLCARDHT